MTRRTMHSLHPRHLSALKLLLSDFASRRWSEDKLQPLEISFVDVRKAYFNASPVRNLHLAFPKDLGIPPGHCAHLKRCVYGTRDAGLLWESCYTQVLTAMGFIRGQANPCCFKHPSSGLTLVVHGDDFTCVGSSEHLSWYETQLAKAFEIKIRGRMGESKGRDREMRMLSKIVRLDSSGLSIEADPRHEEILIKALGLEDSNYGVTPADKSLAIEQDATVNDDPESPSQQMQHAHVHDNLEPINNFLKVRVVNFEDVPEIHHIVPYCQHYSSHPRDFVFRKDGSMNFPRTA